MNPEPVQTPPRFRNSQTVYCSGPSHPVGVTFGQPPLPSRLVNSILVLPLAPPGEIVISVILAVAAQSRTFGEFTITALPRSIMSAETTGAGPTMAGIGCTSGSSPTITDPGSRRSHGIVRVTRPGALMMPV